MTMKTVNDVIAFIRKAMELNLEITNFISLSCINSGITIINNTNEQVNIVAYNNNEIRVYTKFGSLNIKISSERELLQFKSVILEAKDYMHKECLAILSNFLVKNEVDSFSEQVNLFDEED